MNLLILFQDISVFKVNLWFFIKVSKEIRDLVIPSLDCDYLKVFKGVYDISTMRFSCLFHGSSFIIWGIRRLMQETDAGLNLGWAPPIPIQLKTHRYINCYEFTRV